MSTRASNGCGRTPNGLGKGFEFRHTLNTYDDAHDFSINPFIFAQTVCIQASVKLELAAV